MIVDAFASLGLPIWQRAGSIQKIANVLTQKAHNDTVDAIRKIAEEGNTLSFDCLGSQNIRIQRSIEETERDLYWAEGRKELHKKKLKHKTTIMERYENTKRKRESPAESFQ